MELGVVYSCLEDKMFTARRGRGAFCNGELLQVSEQTGQSLRVILINKPHQQIHDDSDDKS